MLGYLVSLLVVSMLLKSSPSMLAHLVTLLLCSVNLKNKTFLVHALETTPNITVYNRKQQLWSATQL